jgi:hypothetical protein
MIKRISVLFISIAFFYSAIGHSVILHYCMKACSMEHCAMQGSACCEKPSVKKENKCCAEKSSYLINPFSISKPFSQKIQKKFAGSALLKFDNEADNYINPFISQNVLSYNFSGYFHDYQAMHCVYLI